MKYKISRDAETVKVVRPDLTVEDTFVDFGRTPAVVINAGPGWCVYVEMKEVPDLMAALSQLYVRYIKEKK